MGTRRYLERIKSALVEQTQQHRVSLPLPVTRPNLGFYDSLHWYYPAPNQNPILKGNHHPSFHRHRFLLVTTSCLTGENLAVQEQCDESGGDDEDNAKDKDDTRIPVGPVMSWSSWGCLSDEDVADIANDERIVDGRHFELETEL